MEHNSNDIKILAENILSLLNEDTPMQPQAQAQPQVAQAPAVQPAAPVQQEPAAQPDASQEGEGTDEVDESEVQEMAGQLAQLLRDYKSSAEDGGVEASKFAAGMVVAAAIKDLGYKDRKDILKKLKAGGYSGEENQEGGEEVPAEEQPVQAPAAVAESFRMKVGKLKEISQRLSGKSSRERMSREKTKPAAKKGSPFASPLREDDENTQANTMSVNNADDISKIATVASNEKNKESNQSLTIYNNTPAGKSGNSNWVSANVQKNDVNGIMRNLSLGKSVNVVNLAESVVLTKKNFEKIRINEAKKNGYTIKKGLLDKFLF